MSVDPAALEALHRGLRDQLAQFTNSDEWLGWLADARHFHRYSPNNQMLLAAQGARGYVASYRTWQRLPDINGAPCQVRKGEHGLTILAPITVTRRDVDEATGDEIVVAGALRGFRTVKVFHQGQLVTPPALHDPPMPALLTGPDRWQHVWAAVVEQLADEGYPVELHTARPGETWNGRTHFGDGYVEVMDHLEPPQRLKTLLHEWAHVSLRHGDADAPASRDLLEVEAESATFLLCRTVGLDSSQYSVPYLAGWANGDLDLMETTAQRILQTTATMVDILETRLSIDLTPDLFTIAPAPPTPLPTRPTAAALTPSGDTPLAHPSSVVDSDVEPPTPAEAKPVVLTLVRTPFPDDAPPALHDLMGRLLPGDWSPLIAAANNLDRPHRPRRRRRPVPRRRLRHRRHRRHTARRRRRPDRPAPLHEAQPRRQRRRHRWHFDNIDAAFRVGDPPAGFDHEQLDMLDRLDVDDVDIVTVAIRQLKATHRPDEIAAALHHYRVAPDDIAAAMTAADVHHDLGTRSDDAVGPPTAAAPGDRTRRPAASSDRRRSRPATHRRARHRPRHELHRDGRRLRPPRPRPPTHRSRRPRTTPRPRHHGRRRSRQRMDRPTTRRRLEHLPR